MAQKALLRARSIAMELNRLDRRESMCPYLRVIVLRRASSISLLFRKQTAMVVMGDLGRAVMGILLMDPMVEMARVVKARTEALATMEDRRAALDQEAKEDRKKVQALTMGLAGRTQALSHKSTCTLRS